MSDQAEGVYKILTVQQIEGIEDNFLVQLKEDGKKVRRSRSELLSIAPLLLAQFDSRNQSHSHSHSNSSSKPSTASPGPRSSSRQPRQVRATTQNRGSYEEPASSDDASESGEEDEDESGEFEVDSEEDDGTRKRSSGRSKRKMKEVSEEKPTRVSSRSQRRGRVDYKLDGEGEEENDEDEMELDEQEEEEVEEEEMRDEETERGVESRGNGKGKEKEVITLSSGEEGDELDDTSPEGTIQAEEQDEQEEPEEEPEEESEIRPQDKHYLICANPKCQKAPAAQLLAAHEQRLANRRKPAGRSKKSKKKRHEDEYDTDEEIAMDQDLCAWVECDNCVSAYHFSCLSSPVQKAIKAKLVKKKDEFDTDKVLRVGKCTTCEKPGGRTCFECEGVGKKITEFEKEHFEKDKKLEENGNEDVKMEEDVGEKEQLTPGLMFRCSTCKRTAHYGCLEPVQFLDAETTMSNHTLSYYKDGVCHDCHKFDDLWSVQLDVILGWRESEKASRALTGEKVRDRKTGKDYVLPNAKDLTSPAEYLVKWKGWSYRVGDLDWVKHSWLAARYQSKLANFLTKGSTVTFEQSKEELGDEEEPDFGDGPKEPLDYLVGPAPDPQLEAKIPIAWKTVDRVMNVLYTNPATGRIISFDRFKDRPEDDRESVKLVAKAYMKWGGLPYSQSTDQEPPKEGEEGYESYFKAYQAFIIASQRSMRVPRLAAAEMAKLDTPRTGNSPIFTKQPDTVKGGELMPFQIQGLNFLLNHWWVKTGCILADEMGLGKTCQLICFLSYLNSVQKARPFLIVVPNSLVSNWLREFARWAPELRTVAYNGDAESRRIVEQYEMFADNGDLKSHVVITTYEALKNHARVFARCTRWDCVVIDEGQALKSGEGNKLWAGIDTLHIGIKILLTGTPLNNNLRELYNLLHFLEPEKFPDVDALSDTSFEMTKERVDSIRADLAPYMLRRTKDQVLNLPPLGEFVVPVNLTMLQRQLYRGILEKNSAAILSIVNNAGKTKGKAKTTATSNTLMTLRKIVCHPYLHVPELDPGDSVSREESFRQLTDASAKLLLLERMLPKLREKGHKVLIFSQFKIVLNKLGPFLDGIGTKWLRLDGDTPQLDRQRDVDRFNDPNSPYSVFILSTRAGGVGLTLTSADVVIIFDQDFNPFQDMQAIARAHRIGQKNPVRVFRLLVKGTCEEKILYSGRKKQGLEHLIISRIDAKDDETEDVSSALQYGAQAILEADDEEAEKSAKRYTDAEIDELLSKTAEPLDEAAKENAGAFATAQVWVSEKGGLSDVADVAGAANGEAEAEEDLGGFWDRIVAKEAAKDQEKKDLEEAAFGGGRQKRARKAVNYQVPTAIVPMTAAEIKKRNKKKSGAVSDISSGDDYRLRPEQDDDSSDGEFMPAIDAEDRRLVNGDQDNSSRPSTLAQTNSAAVPGSTMSKAEAEEAAMNELREKKLKKRRKAIKPLLEAAHELGDQEVINDLSSARDEKNATVQKTLIVKAAKRINLLNAALVDRPDIANSAQPPPAPAPPLPIAGKKRKSDSPLDLPDKRQKPSSSNHAQPSSTSTTERPVTSNKTQSTASSSSSSTIKNSSAAPMIRSDSNSSTSEPVKKAPLKQGTLSFGPKPPSDRKPSPLASTTSAQAAKPPSHSHSSKGDDKITVNGSSSVSATLQQKKPTPGSLETRKASETITLSDSD